MAPIPRHVSNRLVMTNEKQRGYDTAAMGAEALHSRVGPAGFYRALEGESPAPTER